MEEGAHLGHLSYSPALGLGLSPPPPCFRVLFGKVQQCSICRDQTTGDLNSIICKFYLCPPPHLFFQQFIKKSIFVVFTGTFGLFGGARAPQAPPWVRHCIVLFMINTNIMLRRLELVSAFIDSGSNGYLPL